MRDLVMVSFVTKRAHNVKSDDMVLCRWKETFQSSFTHYLEAGVKRYKVRWQLAISNVTVLSESLTSIALPASTHIFREFRNNWIFMRLHGSDLWWKGSKDMLDNKSTLCMKMSFETHCVPWPHFLVLSFIDSMESFLFFFIRQVWIFQS